MLAVELAAEQAMDSVWGHSEAGRLAAPLAILDSLGHSAEAVEFILDPSSYYFPNRRGNHLIKPSSAPEEGIAVVALERGEKLNFERPSLHYLQRKALQGAGLGRWAVPDTERELSKVLPVVYGNGGSEGCASMYAPPVVIRDARGAVVESKPTLVLNFGSAVRTFCGGLVLHELVHGVQMLSNPIRKTDKAARLARELEAYAVQAPLAHTDGIPVSDTNEAAWRIDQFRKLHLGTNLYVPDTYFMQQFEDKTEFRKIWDKL